MGGIIRNALLALAFIAPAAAADVRLPRLLSDGAILQRDTPATVWGWADDGETVTISLDGRPVGTAEPAGGRWQLKIGPVAAGGPHELQVEGDNSITIGDVYFGDVWIAGGQSNMQLPMERVKEKYPAEIAHADFPLIREFTVPRQYDFDGPREDLDGGEWVSATPESVLDFSAAAYFFAYEIHNRYRVPVGIVSSNYGGTTAEGWMSAAALASYPKYLKVAERYRDDAYLENIRADDKAVADAWYAGIDRNDKGLKGPIHWNSPDYDDSGWQRLKVPGGWSDTALGPVNGVFWFRTTFELPASAAGQPAKLYLGRLVDADTTWINGSKVGAITYQYPPRRYPVEAGILRAGENSIAVRLISTTGEGGFAVGKPYELQVGTGPTERTIDLSGEWRFHVGAISEPLPRARFVEYEQPLGFYNAMMAPLQKMTIKGVIWYQGAANTDHAADYVDLFPALIRDWRNVWNQGDFPFLFVQLPNFGKPVTRPSRSAWAEIRDAQRKSLRVPDTAMAVTIDVGDWFDLHPLNKKAVGHRLALAARKLAYGEQDLVSSGPLFRSLETRGEKLILTFDHTGSGLKAKGGALYGFAVAGRDGVYSWARAKIDGDKVIVWNDTGGHPVSVRYAWADDPASANLYNREGLPASPFQASADD